MLFFAHTGITLGVAELLSSVARRRSRPVTGHGAVLSPDDPPETEVATLDPRVAEPVETRPEAAWQLDYRVVLVGSLLPDIIDKPLGTTILRDFISNGRIISHTLVAAIAMWLAAAQLFLRRGRTWGLGLALGSLVHIALDQMWREPETLLWPLLGWRFPRHGMSGWLTKVLRSMFTNPHDYVADIAGALILVRFGFRLARQRQIRAFMKHGRAG